MLFPSLVIGPRMFFFECLGGYVSYFLLSISLCLFFETHCFVFLSLIVSRQLHVTGLLLIKQPIEHQARVIVECHDRWWFLQASMSAPCANKLSRLQLGFVPLKLACISVHGLRCTIPYRSCLAIPRTFDRLFDCPVATCICLRPRHGAWVHGTVVFSSCHVYWLCFCLLITAAKTKSNLHERGKYAFHEKSSCAL